MEALAIWLAGVIVALVFAIITAYVFYRKWQDEIDYQDCERESQLVKAHNYIPTFIEELEKAECLAEVYIVHLKMWGAGLRNGNVGPDMYGMFRCADIFCMKPQDIFLGGVYGLNTHPIPFWEEAGEKDKAVYAQVLMQYKTHLISNLRCM